VLVSYTMGPLVGVAIVVGAATVLLPRTWVTGVRLERDGSRLAGVLRFASVAVLFPVALVVLVTGQFSPFLYFQF
jgi:hypothetical protein